MKKWFLWSLFIIFCFTTLLLVFGNQFSALCSQRRGLKVGETGVQKMVGKGKPTIVKDFGNIPLYFIPNKGQMDDRALFYAKTSRYTLWMTRQGLVFHSMKKVEDCSLYSPKYLCDVSCLIFLNADKDPVIVPEDPTAYRVNYLKGSDKSRWYSNIPTSKAVCYKNLYKNIDLKVYGIEKQIEYDWVVKPGGKPGDIQFQYRGAENVSIDGRGNLVVQTAFGKWCHKRPVSYQVIDGKKIAVEAAFEKQEEGEHTFRFKVSGYNKDYALVIDPMVVAFSSYLGGNDSEGINDMTIDGAGSMVVMGETWSTDFPTANEYQSVLSGMADGFVTKFSPDGNSLVFSTYLGGSDYEIGNGIKVDSSGAVYVTGVIMGSDSADFPVVNAYQAVPAGGMEGFISKLSADGSSLLYSTYLGGSGGDEPFDIAVNNSGEIFVAGYTDSDDFPVQNPLQSNRAGMADAFITKFSSTGASLVYSTYLGGSNYDDAWGITVGSSGAAYIGGSTGSTDFPTVNAYQSTKGTGGSSDGIVAKVSPDGSTLVYSSYLGGNYEDVVYDVDVDGSENLYAVGFSGSNNFPTTAGAFQETKPGYDYIYEGFITKFSAAGSSLVYSTYLGGSGGRTEVQAITLHSGSAYVSGQTRSQNFPVVEELFGPPWEASAAIVTKLSADGGSLEFSSCLGMVNSFGYAVAVDNGGSIYFAGHTGDSYGAYQGLQEVYGGGYSDAFLSKIVYSDIGELTLIAPNGGETWLAGSVQNITWTGPSTIKNISIDYTYDDWWTVEVITDSTPNTGTYSWTVPFTPSPQCKVGIRDATMGGPILEDSSEDFFTISTTPLEVTSPRGGDNLIGSSTHDITWVDNGTISYVSIDYCTDGGSVWIPIVSNIPNTGSYTWTVPEVSSNECLVKVSDVSGDPWNTNPGYFTITPSSAPMIQVTSPNDGEAWTMGTPRQITWTYSGAITNVNIDYSTDNGGNWTSLVTSTPNTGSYDWTIPNIPSNQCLVRVSDESGTPTDTSDAVFSINAPPLPQAERDALIALYNNTFGDSWKKNTNWRHPENSTQFNDPGTEYTWYGIYLNADYTHVEKIYLGNNDLIGTIPDLSGLTELQYLGLGFNQLDGDIPAALNNLIHLTHLSLNNNGLDNAIPDLGALTDLDWLSLANNNLTGNVPTWLNNLSQLSLLNLSNNSLSGTIPDLGGMASLEYFYLYNNSLSGTIPTWLNNMSNLVCLGLSGNQLTGTIPDLSNLLQLKRLHLSGNQLTGSIPTWVNNFTQLTDLYLDENQLSGPIPDLSNLTGLIYLQLNDNQLTGPIPNLTGLTILNRLYLSNNRLSGGIPAELGQVTSLIYLYLNGNQLTGSLPSSLSNLTNLSNTETDFRWNGLYTDDQGLRDFLNSKQIGGDWESTQTIAPTGVSTGGVTENSINVSWTPITYQGDTGGYNVYYSTTAGSGYILAGTTADKTVDNYTVTNLTPNTTYYFVVETFTDPHADNQNTVTGEYSTEVSAITLVERTLTVTVPNSGETWEGNYNQDITWNSTGAIANVKIEYSTDNGGLWNTVIASTANSGSYTWTVPNIPSTTCLVKISDTAGPVSDISDAVFTIVEQRTITVTAPNNGEDWMVGSSQDITWMTTGSIGTVSIDYSTDGGGIWNSIVSSTGNTGTYNWTIPDDQSSNCLVRISDTAGPAADTSDAVFTISPARISQLQRDALIAFYNSTNGDSWYNNSNWRKPGEPTQFNGPGTEHTWYGVTCNAEKTQVIEINLYQNNLSGPITDLSALTELITLDLGYNQLTGNIPVELNNLTQLANLKLYINQLTGSIPDLSNLANLTTLELYNNQLTGNIPAWLNNLANLTSLSLRDNALSGSIPDLSILANLSILNLSANQLTGDIPAWLNNLTNLKELWLYNNQLSGVIPDLSNLTQLTHLSLSNNMISGSIPGCFSGLTNLKEIFLSNTLLSGSLPDLSNLTQLELFSASNNNLTGSIANIAGLVQAQRVYLHNNRFSGTIPAELGNLTNLITLHMHGNMLIGEIPGALSNLTNLNMNGLEIRWNGLYTSDTGLRDFLNTKQFGGNWESTQTIAPTGLSTGEETHNSVKISWTPIPYQLNSGGYRVYYSTTSGSGYTLAGTTANKTVDNYTVTGLDPATTYYFVVETFTDSHTDNKNTVVSEYSSEVSAATFETPTLTVTAPNGGQSWEATTSQVITWNSTGNITEVKIEYSTDNGGLWNTVIASTANSGSYNWTVPNTPSTTCLVRISDTAGPAVDVSNAAFTIAEQRTITITAPNGGQRWFIDSTYPITWLSTGSIASVMIEYSTNSGDTWNTITGSTANSGSYNWTIPNTPSTSCLVRVSDTAGPAADVSNAVFTIDPYPTITVISPNDGEIWDAGITQTQTITWTYTGTIANVNIDYSADGGALWNSIALSVPNTGSYNWVLPAVDSNNCLVRISDTVTSASDMSDAVFTIWQLPSITVTAPDGGESWRRRTVHTITWNTTGNIQDVKIQYSRDAGSYWINIVSSTANDGSYQWTVPNVNRTKTQCLVRIMTIDGTVVDTSNNYFTILK